MRCVLTGGLVLALTLGTAAFAQEDVPPPAPVAPEATPSPTPTAKRGVFATVGAELGRWGSDSVALVKAPGSWDKTDWTRFGVLSASLGGLMLADRSVYRHVEDHRTESGDQFARAVTPVGAEYAFGVSASLLVGGLVFSAPGIRDTGREAIEASVLSAVIGEIMKPVFGRERPYVSNGETVFHPFSREVSFPSGHTTEAFAVASVIAMHSDGWVVPTIAYTAASLVAVSRVEQSLHFTSDVFAGAVLGISVGRFVVTRHQPVLDGPPGAVQVTFVTIPHGVAVHASW